MKPEVKGILISRGSKTFLWVSPGFLFAFGFLQFERVMHRFRLTDNYHAWCGLSSLDLCFGLKDYGNFSTIITSKFLLVSSFSSFWHSKHPHFAPSEVISEVSDIPFFSPFLLAFFPPSHSIPASAHSLQARLLWPLGSSLPGPHHRRSSFWAWGSYVQSFLSESVSDLQRSAHSPVYPGQCLPYPLEPAVYSSQLFVRPRATLRMPAACPSKAGWWSSSSLGPCALAGPTFPKLGGNISLAKWLTWRNRTSGNDKICITY